MPFRPDRLKALREVKGLSQEQLAEKARVSHSVIAKSENGKNIPRSDALDKLAQGLDCTTDYLLGRGPDYKNLAAAAAHMAFEVFASQNPIGSAESERCRRAIQHVQAPRSAESWHAFAEMLNLAAGPAAPATSLTTLTNDLSPKAKPMAVARPKGN